MKRYGILRKKDGLWFSGFDVDDRPKWGSENEAKPYAEKLYAEVQAMLFTNA